MELKEEHSISSEVMDIVGKIIKKIKGNIDINKKCKISKLHRQRFYEGTVKEWLSSVSDDRTQIRINYTIYYFDYLTQNDVDFLNRIGMDCEADHTTNTITIVSYMIGDSISNDLNESLSHEVLHLYQYHMGFCHDEKKYDEIVDLAQHGSEIEREIGMALYYSYSHEQDAYTHQFYSFLMHQKPFSDAETCINNYFYYNNFKKCIAKVLQRGRKIENELKNFGYTYDSFRNYTNKQLNRFHRKLHHAFEKYSFDKELVLHEMNFRRHMLNETELDKWQKINNGVHYELGIEPFYRRYKWDIHINETKHTKI